MNSDVLVVANINMDFVFEVNNFPIPGKIMRFCNFKRCSGGEGDNQALEKVKGVRSCNTTNIMLYLSHVQTITFRI